MAAYELHNGDDYRDPDFESTRQPIVLEGSQSLVDLLPFGNVRLVAADDTSVELWPIDEVRSSNNRVRVGMRVNLSADAASRLTVPLPDEPTSEVSRFLRVCAGEPGSNSYPFKIEGWRRRDEEGYYTDIYDRYLILRDIVGMELSCDAEKGRAFLATIGATAAGSICADGPH